MLRSNIVQIVSLLGIPGIYLYICRRLKISPMRIKIPIFGYVKTFHEVRNIFDNFGGSGELRDKSVERFISKKAEPCVIDCGVNVGITVRWWFHLNRGAKVYGVDMMKEAQEFTVKAIGSIGVSEDNYTPIVAALWSEDGKQFKVGIGDPLYGDHGLYRKGKEISERTFITNRLDTIFDHKNIICVDLLKIDIEGAGGEALKGAGNLLKKTGNIFLETHSIEESNLAGDILKENDFILRRSSARHQWWARASQREII